MEDKKCGSLSESQIVRGCIDRDNSCRAALYDRYAKDLYQCALRYTCNVEDAEDVLQDSFIQIFDKIRQFRQEGSLFIWMRTIVIRQALLQYRKNLKKWQRDLPIDDENADTLGDESIVLHDNMDYQFLLKLIQSLPDGYRMVFNLYEIEGYSYAETAEFLHCSEANCRSQLSRAKALLRKKLEGYTDIYSDDGR